MAAPSEVAEVDLHGDPAARRNAMEVESVTGSEEASLPKDSSASTSLHMELPRASRPLSAMSWPRTQATSSRSWAFASRCRQVVTPVSNFEAGAGGSSGSRHWCSAARPVTSASDFLGVQPSSPISLPDFRSWALAEAGEARNRPPSRDLADELRLSASRLLLDVERRAAHSAGLAAPWEPQTFLCLVCFENQRMDRRFVLSQCQVSGHSCCKECAARFFRCRIQQGRVFELVCPVGAADGGCGLGDAGQEVASATPEEVEKCLASDEATLVKYHRFVRAKVDPSLRECPDCKCLCSPTLDDDGRPQPAMECGMCGSEFCYYHAAAHRGGSCEEYEMRLAAETKGISLLFGTRNCPRCTRQTMKSGGCNHMTCQVCRCEWCWACGQQLTVRGPHGEDAIFWHYTDDNIDSGCRQFAQPGAQQDADAVRLWRRERRPGVCIRALCGPVRNLSVALLIVSCIFSLLLWIVVYSVSSLVLTLVCLTIRGGYRITGSKAPEGLHKLQTHQLVQPTLYFTAVLGLVFFLVPFTVLSLAWSFIALVFWLCLFILSSIPLLGRCVPTTTRHHLRFLISAPLHAVHQFGSATLARLADTRAQQEQAPH
mmetsp:Transcript_34946/g.96637  ORF Transcript_34946/g.96637 Transcript_34946/m.96637 type:complete len:600 (-) Transcript_34946:64-1863(-)